MPITTTQPVAISEAERHRLFTLYVEPRIDAIRRLVAMTTLSGEDPDDAFQDVLLHLFTKIERYNPAAGAFEPWYRQVVRNFQRSRAVQPFSIPFQSLDGIDPPAPLGPSALDTYQLCAPEPAAPSPSEPARDISDFFSHVATDDGSERITDEGQRLADALATLTDRQRDVLLLVAEGWTIAAIARRLRLAPTAVSAILYRAREKMKAELRPRTFHT